MKIKIIAIIVIMTIGLLLVSLDSCIIREGYYYTYMKRADSLYYNKNKIDSINHIR